MSNLFNRILTRGCEGIIKSFDVERNKYINNDNNNDNDDVDNNNNNNNNNNNDDDDDNNNNNSYNFE